MFSNRRYEAQSYRGKLSRKTKKAIKKIKEQGIYPKLTGRQIIIYSSKDFLITADYSYVPLLTQKEIGAFLERVEEPQDI